MTHWTIHDLAVPVAGVLRVAVRMDVGLLIDHSPALVSSVLATDQTTVVTPIVESRFRLTDVAAVVWIFSSEA
jgi:hypothetical protein